MCAAEHDGVHGGDGTERGGGGVAVQEDEAAYPRRARWLGAAGNDHSGRSPARTGTASGGRGEGREHDVDGDDGRATKQGRYGAGRDAGGAGEAPACGDEAAAAPGMDELGAVVGWRQRRLLGRRAAWGWEAR